MSPVTTGEIRVVDDQVEALKKYSQYLVGTNSSAILHVIRVVVLIWEITKRHNGWR